MTFPLFSLADRIAKQRTRVRQRRALADVQSDPHLARDIGLPFEPREPRTPEQW